MLEIYPFLTSLIVFFVFNFFSRSFLGDGGSYLIAAFTGILLINFVNNLPNLISPYYIILLLWYPAFENLFTISEAGSTFSKGIFFVLLKSKRLLIVNMDLL